LLCVERDAEPQGDQRRRKAARRHDR